MAGLSEGVGLLLGVIGLLTFGAAAYVWHLVPRETVARLREELSEQRARIADRDKELAEFRGLRVGDIRRLDIDEARIRKLDAEVTELRSWRYGAERYIRALETELKRCGVTCPERSSYGIGDGEEP